ncbi:hypothetical protein [Streptomyces inhibens]|uniref:hypothetical protein n=1 Tax=Streptomyces inhibens TaxID=2293571 RepID=UPI001EE6A323|nr:hypothetical protein [Streptomyces inhibens]UKY54667.1 hypothetical protein KI385_41645 [Streptomyces inhibens]
MPLCFVSSVADRVEVVGGVALPLADDGTALPVTPDFVSASAVSAAAGRGLPSYSASRRLKKDR